jgi:hypothetical protein
MLESDPFFKGYSLIRSKTTMPKDKSEKDTVTNPPNDLQGSPIGDMVKEAMTQPLESMVIYDQNNIATPEEVRNFVLSVATSFVVSNQTAFAGISLLFLKGAANKGTPQTCCVDVVTEDGKSIVLQKYDLFMACQKVCGNKFLRRLARSMAKEIGMFAESKNLNGDLAIKLNNEVIANEESPLTSKEKAWASSFSQQLPELEKLSGGSRIPTLLAKDSKKRLEKAKSKPKPEPGEKAPPVPKKKGGKSTPPPAASKKGGKK